jgi:type IV pilus assembly protein PilO
MPRITADSIVKLPKTQKILILAAFIILLVGLYIYLSVIPSLQIISTKEEQLAKQQKELMELRKVVADLPRFEKELADLEAQFKNALTLLPNTREIPSLLTNISNLAGESGLEIMLFQPKPEVPENFYAQIPVEMKIIGRYHDVGLFFDRVSKLPRIVNILDIAMDRKAPQRKGMTDTRILNASFKAVTYKFIEAKQEENAKGKKGPKKKKS